MTLILRFEWSKGPFEWHWNNFVKIRISPGMCVDRIERQKHESVLLYFLLAYIIYRFSATEKKKSEIKDRRK